MSNSDHNPSNSKQKKPAEEPIKTSSFSFAKKTEDEPAPYRDWMDIAFKEYQASGGMDHLTGQGKPIKPPNGDPLNSVLAEAGYKPAWLELQHKIRDQLIQLIDRSKFLDEQTLQQEVDQLNQQIAKLNREVPSPHLQKTRIFPDIMEKQIKHWL